MTEDIFPSDLAILDLLRERESLSVSEVAEVMGVTATAVRQRLTRLLDHGYIDRVPVRARRGRPSYRYRLTSKGYRESGTNFADLAAVLWEELRQIEDTVVRRGMFQRIAKRLAELYSDKVEGATLGERMASIAELFGQRRIPFTVDQSGDLPVLTALACPYPALADQDRGICAMEQTFLSELLGERVCLNECRLDGGNRCTFSPLSAGSPLGGSPLGIGGTS